MTKKERNMVAEARRQFNFIVNYDPAKGGQQEVKLDLLPLDRYSNTLVEKTSKKIKKYFQYENAGNYNLIIEGSFNKVIDTLHNKDWAIISAFFGDFDLQDNIKRNRMLRSQLNSKQAGAYQMVGHWREAPSGVEYKDATEDQLTDVVERSYLVQRPKDIGYEEFKSWITSLLTIDGVTQNCGIIHKSVDTKTIGHGKISVENDEYYLLYPDGSTSLLGTNLTANKIAQAYSQYVRKLDVPFVFEGVEYPGGVSGRMMFDKAGINGTLLY
jgi:hypothetical protein